MDNLWQLCRTIGPLLSQRFPLASAKAQPRGEFLVSTLKSYRYYRKVKNVIYKVLFIRITQIWQRVRLTIAIKC